LGGQPDLQRIDPNRLDDVLECRLAEIVDREIKPRAHLTVSVLGKTNGAGQRDSLQASGDIDAVAHKVAVAFLDDVAEVNADPELDAPVRWHACVPLDHRVLDFHGAAHGVDDAAELDE
jgi:hypothetical protein